MLHSLSNDSGCLWSIRDLQKEQNFDRVYSVLVSRNFTAPQAFEGIWSVWKQVGHMEGMESVALALSWKQSFVQMAGMSQTIRSLSLVLARVFTLQKWAEAPSQACFFKCWSFRLTLNFEIAKGPELSAKAGRGMWKWCRVLRPPFPGSLPWLSVPRQSQAATELMAPRHVSQAIDIPFMWIILCMSVLAVQKSKPVTGKDHTSDWASHVRAERSKHFS